MKVIYLIGEKPNLIEAWLFSKFQEVGFTVSEVPLQHRFHISQFPGEPFSEEESPLFDVPIVLGSDWDLCIHSSRYEPPEGANWDLWPYPTVHIDPDRIFEEYHQGIPTEEYFQRLLDDCTEAIKNFKIPILPEKQKEEYSMKGLFMIVRPWEVQKAVMTLQSLLIPCKFDSDNDRFYQENGPHSFKLLLVMDGIEEIPTPISDTDLRWKIKQCPYIVNEGNTKSVEMEKQALWYLFQDPEVKTIGQIHPGMWVSEDIHSAVATIFSSRQEINKVNILTKTSSPQKEVTFIRKDAINPDWFTTEGESLIKGTSVVSVIESDNLFGFREDPIPGPVT